MSKVTKEKTDPDVESYFIRCDCGAHLINVSAFVEDFDKENGFDLVYITFYTTDSRYSWKNRVKEAWRILRSGLGGGSDIVIRAEEATELGERLIHLAKKVGGMEDGC